MLESNWIANGNEVLRNFRKIYRKFWNFAGSSSCVFSSFHPMVRVVYFLVIYFRVFTNCLNFYSEDFCKKFVFEAIPRFSRWFPATFINSFLLFEFSGSSYYFRVPTRWFELCIFELTEKIMTDSCSKTLEMSSKIDL